MEGQEEIRQVDDGLLNEDQLRAEQDRGHRARRIYENDLFKDAAEAIKDDIWKAFRKSNLDDDAIRRTLRLQLDLLDGFLQTFRHHMETGMLAQIDLELIEEKAKRIPKRVV